MSAEQDTAGTPEAPAQELAGRGTRLGAAILDGLVALVPYVLILLGRYSMILGILGGLGLLALIIVQIYLLSTAGQSLGKRWLSIRIVKVETGENGGFVTNVLLRVVLNAIISIVPLYALVDILFIFREDRRCIHDLIAKTRVVVS